MCIEMVLMFVNVSCSEDFLIFNVFLRISIDGICVEPLAHAIKTIIGRTFHLTSRILCNSGVYLLVFCCIHSSQYLLFV